MLGHCTAPYTRPFGPAWIQARNRCATEHKGVGGPSQSAGAWSACVQRESWCGCALMATTRFSPRYVPIHSFSFSLNEKTTCQVLVHLFLPTISLSWISAIFCCCCCCCRHTYDWQNVARVFSASFSLISLAEELRLGVPQKITLLPRYTRYVSLRYRAKGPSFLLVSELTKKHVPQLHVSTNGGSIPRQISNNA